MVSMFVIYVHEEAPEARENVDFADEPDDEIIEAWVVDRDHPDRPLFDACAEEDKDLVFDSLEQAVRKLVFNEVELVAASEAWTRKEGKSKNGGLNAKGRRSYKGGL